MSRRLSAQRSLCVVVRVEFLQMPYTQAGQGRNRLYLNCGHSKSQKTSVPIPKRSRCLYCYRSTQL